MHAQGGHVSPGIGTLLCVLCQLYLTTQLGQQALP